MVALTTVTLRVAGVSRSAGLLRAVARQQSAAAAAPPSGPRVLASEQAATVWVEGAPHRIINLASANYLGMTDRVAVTRASGAALNHYGAGLATRRGATGTHRLHLDLEQKLSLFHGREAALVCPGDWDASVGLFSSLLSSEDAVLADARCSSSTQAGIALCSAKKHTYTDMDDLESQLIAARGSRLRVIAADGVYESDVTLADLPRLVQLAEEHNAYIVLNETHAAGVTGSTGRGTEELFGVVKPELVVITGSLSTSLGGAGGSYTTGPKEVIELLRHTSKPYLTAVAMSPAAAASAITALELLLDREEGSLLLQQLHSNTRLWRGRLTQAGLTLQGDHHPLCPVLLPSRHCTTTFAEDLFKLGVLVDQSPADASPAVRAVVTARHTRGQLQCAIDAFYTVAQQRALVPQSPHFQTYTRRNPDYMDIIGDELLQC